MTTQTISGLSTYPIYSKQEIPFLFHDVTEKLDQEDRTDDLDELKDPFPPRYVFRFKSSSPQKWLIAEQNPPYFEPVFSHIKNKMIDQIHFRKRWEEEGIKPPNIACKYKIKDICRHLFEKYELIPQRVNASIEGGIFVLYLNPENKRTLSIEIYNDLDVAALVNDEENNKIINSQDITGMFFESIMKHFYA